MGPEGILEDLIFIRHAVYSEPPPYFSRCRISAPAVTVSSDDSSWSRSTIDLPVGSLNLSSNESHYYSGLGSETSTIQDTTAGLYDTPSRSWFNSDRTMDFHTPVKNCESWLDVPMHPSSSTAATIDEPIVPTAKRRKSHNLHST